MLNDIKRTLLSIKEHKKDTILIFLIVLILTTFMMIYWVFYLSAEQMSKSINNKTKVSIEINGRLFKGCEDENKLHELFENMHENKNEIEDDHFINCLKSYTNYFNNTYNLISGLSKYDYVLENKYVVKADFICLLENDTYKNNVTISSFDNGLLENYKLINGRYFTQAEIEGGGSSIIVDSDIFLTNNDGITSQVCVGDTIILLNGNNEEKVFEVIGVVKKENANTSFSDTDLYNNPILLPSIDILSFAGSGNYLRSSNIYVTVEGKENFDNTLSFLQNHLINYKVSCGKESINNSLEYTVDDSLNNSLQVPIQSIKKLFQVISYIMLIVMFILLFSLLIYVSNSRRRDFGIFIAMGQTKAKTIFNFLSEILIISTMAFLISAPISYKIGISISDYMISTNLKVQEKVAKISNYQEDKDIFEISVSVNNEYKLEFNFSSYLIVYGFVLAIILTSCTFSLINISLIKPKELLVNYSTIND